MKFILIVAVYTATGQLDLHLHSNVYERSEECQTVAEVMKAAATETVKVEAKCVGIPQ